MIAEVATAISFFRLEFCLIVNPKLVAKAGGVQRWADVEDSSPSILFGQRDLDFIRCSSDRQYRKDGNTNAET